MWDTVITVTFDRQLAYTSCWCVLSGNKGCSDEERLAECEDDGQQASNTDGHRQDLADDIDGGLERGGRVQSQVSGETTTR